MSYTPPTASGIIFAFSEGGYSPPDIPVLFRTTASQLAGLQAAINVYSTYQDSTYTYTKNRNLYALGYTRHGIQILRGRIEYGGIRDFGAYIIGSTLYHGSEDLGADIEGVEAFTTSYADLNAYLTVESAVGVKDLNAYIKSVIQATHNLGAYIKQTTTDHLGLLAAIRKSGSGHLDLVAHLHGLDTSDLTSYIGTHPPANISAAIKSWYVDNVRNLPTAIIGELFKGSGDLNANLDTYKPPDLQGIIHGWDTLNLQAYIKSIYASDLGAIIQSTSLANLISFVTAVEPSDIQGFLHGWDERFLSAEIEGGYGPYDLQAYLRVYPHADLISRIHGWYSGIGNLQAIVGGYHTRDLAAFISAIEAINLGAEIVARGQAEGLQAFIVPNVIRIRKAVSVALLEHKNLSALINFQCINSTYANLPVEFGIIYKKLDLTGFIFGWLTPDEMGELKCYINTATYEVEDKINVGMVVYEPYTLLKVKFNVAEAYKVFDTLPVIYGTFYYKVLNASIIAVPRSRNLTAYIKPIIQSNYTELPPSVRPKSHVVVYKFNDRMEEEWRRFVEIMFRKDGAEPYHYFYVSGTDKVYKIDRSRHWTIWATSYNRDDETMFDRNNIRTKFIFRMDRYESVDEAVRDLIDRVSAYRESLLAAYINAVDDRPQLNLPTSIFGFGGPKRRWAKYLNASITGVV